MSDELSHWVRKRISRRRLLASGAAVGAAGLLAACGSRTGGAGSGGSKPAAVASPTASAQAAIGAGFPEWQQTLDAAKKEGKLSVDLYPGPGYENVMHAFTKAFPDIKTEYTNLTPVDLAPRMQAERKAGVYTWDVVIIPTTTALQVLRPAGAWDPIRPAIILPEVKDDKVWRGGFDAGFLDQEKQWLYGFTNTRGGSFYINIDQVKPDEIKSVSDLLAPKWKGKIITADPRAIGAGFWPFTVARQKLGDGIVKQFFVDQEPILSRDENQITEFMVRGQHPVGLGVQAVILQKFTAQGLAKNLKQLDLPETSYQASSGVLWLANHAPHPNAAKVFINWLLTKDSQVLWAKQVQINSRMLGVPPGDADRVVPEGSNLYQIDAESSLPEVVKTQDIAKQVIK